MSWHRISSLVALLLLTWAVPASAQRYTQTINRVTVGANSERCTPAAQLVGSDGRIEVKLNISDAHRADPSRRVALRIESGPSSNGPWTLWAGGETWGSPNWTPGNIPTVSTTTAPPSGHGWARVCGRTGPLSVQTGVAISIYDGSWSQIVPPPHHSVAYDASVTVTGSSVGSLTTGSFTVGSNANRACVMMVGNGQSGITVSSTTCAGQSGTSSCGRAITGSTSVHAWHAVAPSSGSQTASVTYSDTWGTYLSLTALTFDDVNQTTPVSDCTTATGTGTAVSVTVPNTVSGGMVVDGVRATSVGTFTGGANQTVRHTSTTSGYGVSTQAGADGGDMTWTLEFSGPWAQVGVRLVEDTTGGGGGTPCTLALLGAGKCGD